MPPAIRITCRKDDRVKLISMQYFNDAVIPKIENSRWRVYLGNNEFIVDQNIKGPRENIELFPSIMPTSFSDGEYFCFVIPKVSGHLIVYHESESVLSIHLP